MRRQLLAAVATVITALLSTSIADTYNLKRFDKDDVCTPLAYAEPQGGEVLKFDTGIDEKLRELNALYGYPFHSTDRHPRGSACDVYFTITVFYAKPEKTSVVYTVVAEMDIAGILFHRNLSEHYRDELPTPLSPIIYRQFSIGYVQSQSEEKMAASIFRSMQSVFERVVLDWRKAQEERQAKR